MRSLATLLRCDTLEDCRRIQRGYLPLRRLAKWSVLFSVAITLLISDVIDHLISKVGQATKDYNDEISDSFWCNTFDLFCPPLAPTEELDKMIAAYTITNRLQFAVFLGWCAYCLRWVYADCRVEQCGITFSRLCWIALLTNLVVYLILKTLFVVFVEWA